MTSEPDTAFTLFLKSDLRINTLMLFSKRRPPPGFYHYLYLREDGTPYYSGKGKGKRAWDKHHVIKPPTDPSLIVITHWGLTELWAFAMERWYIRWYGRKDNGSGILRNQTDGGEGPTGRKSSFKDKTLVQIYGEQRSLEIKDLLKKSLNSDKTKHLKSSITTSLWQDPEYVQRQQLAKENLDKESLGRKMSVILNTPEQQKRMSEQRSSNKNPRYDHTVYSFIHDSGIVEECHRYQLQIKYNLNQGKLSEVVRNKRKSVSGWRLLTR